MNRILSILVATLLMGAGMVHAEEDRTTEQQECDDRYHSDLETAEQDYNDAKEDAAREDTATDGSSSSDRDEELARDEEEYEQDKADAEARYKECLAEAEGSDTAHDAPHEDGSTDGDRATDAGHAAECRAEYEHDLADAEQDYMDKKESATDHEDSDERAAEAATEWEEDKRRAQHDYDECLQDSEDDEREHDLPRSFQGDHIAFELTPSGLRNYSIGGHDILSTVSLRTPVGWEEYEKHGSAIKVEGELAEFKAIDNPVGILKFESEHDKRVYIAFADGVEAVRYVELDHHHDRNGSDVEGRLLLQGDGFEAFLWVDKGYLEEERGIIAAGEFKLAIVHDDSNDRRHDSRTADAIADGRLAVEIDVLPGELRSAEYGDINVTFENATEGLIAIVEGHGEGKTILFNLEEGSYESLDELEVIYDGEAIGFADNLEDVLDISDGVAEYIVIVGAEATQVLVQIPHFSVHTIQLQGATTEVASAVSTVALIVGGGAAAVFVAATLIGRGRRS